MDMPTNNDNDNGGFPPECFQKSSSHGSDSGDTEDDRMSPPASVDESSASKIALQLSPDTPQLRIVIQDLLEGDLTLDIPNDICTEFNATPDGPKYTCSLFKRNQTRCTKSFTRFDRFKHHLQAHMGITPYSCMESPKPTVEPKCGRLFSSAAARDTHVRNKGGPVMYACGTSVLPKNFARHRRTCSTCSANSSPNHSTPS